MTSSYKIILGVIGSGQQPVGNRVMAQVLADHGFAVENLGARSGHGDFVQAAARSGADAILVSCSDAPSEGQCQALRDCCEASGLADILLYLGGRFLAAKGDWDDTEALFLSRGFDRVFPPRANVTRIVEKLKDDIDMRRPGAFMYGVEAFGVAPAVARFG